MWYIPESAVLRNFYLFMKFFDCAYLFDMLPDIFFIFDYLKKTFKTYTDANNSQLRFFREKGTYQG